MIYFDPHYRVELNKNLLDPLFMEYLKQTFNRVLMSNVLSLHLDTGTVYKFTISSIPPGGLDVISRIYIAESKGFELDDKLKEIADILHSLDPFDPKPVEVEFDLGTIISFVKDNVKHFQAAVPGGIIDYFGIDTEIWFNDYPIQTGAVLRAVDFGNLDNPPVHLFDRSFEQIRCNLMDLFAEYFKYVKPVGEVLENADV